MHKTLDHVLHFEITSRICLGPELQCLLKVKQDFSLVLMFQHAILMLNKINNCLDRCGTRGQRYHCDLQKK